MNALAFYILAAVLVVASTAVVALPRMHLASAALAAVAVTMTLLFLLLSAYAMAVAQIVIPAIAASAVWLHIRRERRYDGLVQTSRAHARWWVGGAAAGGLAILLIVVFAASAAGWHSGAGIGSLLTVFHYRAVYALLLGIALAVTAAGAALVVGRQGRDERELDRALDARRQREERERLRREAREAARRRGRPAPVGEENA